MIRGFLLDGGILDIGGKTEFSERVSVTPQMPLVQLGGAMFLAEVNRK
jgi:hypothetical protein